MMPPYLTGGEAVVQSLLKQGIHTVFGLPGVQNDWLYNAFYDADGAIRIIHSRHEQGVAYMALGSYLATGETSVYNVVPGPGMLNASAAFATAYGLNAKVMCLVGQIPTAAIGRDRGVLHEIPDQMGILRSLTKWADSASSPSQVPSLMAEAFRQMDSACPKPVAVEVPMDVLAARGAVNLDAKVGEPYHPPVDTDKLSNAAKMLGAAKKPMIFVGSGAQGVSSEVRQLAEMLQAPVMGYRTGKGVMDARSYLSLEQPAAKEYWRGCDVAFSIGANMRTPMLQWYKGYQPKIIRLDVAPLSHQRFTTPDIALTARAEDALPLLLDELAQHNRKRPSREEELTTLRHWWATEMTKLEPQHSYLQIIREELGEDGIFVDELTQVGFASWIGYPVYHPRSYISTGYQGTLGYGFATAMGAKVARPDVPVISVNGDGGFMFASNELATAVQHNIGLITLVFNNNQYGNVQQMQKHLYDNRVIASDLHNPDFIKFAEAFGAQAIRANSFQQLRAAIQQGIATPNTPTVIEIPVGDMVGSPHMLEAQLAAVGVDAFA